MLVKSEQQILAYCILKTRQYHMLFDSDLDQKVVCSSTRWSLPCTSWQWQNDKLSVTHPKLKHGRSNSHTVTRPAFIQWQLVPPSGKAVLGQNKTGYTFGHAKSASAPSPSTNREANHNFTLWFVKSHSSTGGTKKTFKSVNFMAYRITAFPYCFYCSM